MAGSPMLGGEEKSRTPIIIGISSGGGLLLAAGIFSAYHFGWVGGAPGASPVNAIANVTPPQVSSAKQAEPPEVQSGTSTLPVSSPIQTATAPQAMAAPVGKDAVSTSVSAMPAPASPPAAPPPAAESVVMVAQSTSAAASGTTPLRPPPQESASSREATSQPIREDKALNALYGKSGGTGRNEPAGGFQQERGKSSAPGETGKGGKKSSGVAERQRMEEDSPPIQEMELRPSRGQGTESQARFQTSGRDIPRLQEELRRAMTAKDSATVERLLHELERSKGADNPYLLKLRSFWLITQGKYEEAGEILQQIILRQPEDLEAQANLALVQMHTNRRDEARQRISELLIRFPNDPRLREIANHLR